MTDTETLTLAAWRVVTGDTVILGNTEYTVKKSQRSQSYQGRHELEFTDYSFMRLHRNTLLEVRRTVEPYPVGMIIEISSDEEGRERAQLVRQDVKGGRPWVNAVYGGFALWADADIRAALHGSDLTSPLQVDRGVTFRVAKVIYDPTDAK